MSRYEESVFRLTATVRTMVQEEVGLDSLTVAERRGLAALAAIPDEFFELVAEAAETAPALLMMGAVDPEKVREELQRQSASQKFEKEMMAMIRSVRDASAKRRAELGRIGMRVYRLVQAYAEDGSAPQLSKLVVRMKHALRHGRRNLPTLRG